MIANWVKVVWILIGGTAAAAGAAYVGGVFEPSPGSAPIEAAVQQPRSGQEGVGKEASATGEAAAEQPGTDETKTGEGEQVASLPPADEATDETAPGEQAAAEPAVIVPAFDLVRVEPDGSVVIAGSASPNSTVEVIAGASVIGTDRAGPGGDFAVVLDDPLKPGDYTVVLRATTEDNVVASSAQTAIIAVPETDSGQVLALVEEPGAPSRLITVPTAPESKEKPEMPAKGDRPAANSAEEGEGVAAAEETAPSDESKPEMTAAAEEPAEKTEMAAKETELTGDVADAEAPAEEQVAAVEQPAAEAVETAEPAKPAAPARVAVEAVEIEGRDVFVAGYAEAGATVRVYANDILLGQAVASDAGRFLIEAEKDLPVGDYIVRADMLSADNADVIARAAVPFEREPGEKVAAVAGPQPSGETAADAEGGTATEMADTSGDEQEPEEQMAAKETDSGSQAGGSATSDTAALDLGESDNATDMKSGDSAAKVDDDATMQASAEAGGDGEVAMQEATAPKLQNVSGAVIIRRGDTLWRLSRRVYGRGVRYTTIYLANQDQISDPDRIWPGQVFSVPGETEEGEEADMSAVAEQMASDEASSDKKPEDVASSQD